MGRGTCTGGGHGGNRVGGDCAKEDEESRHFGGKGGRGWEKVREEGASGGG